MAKSDHTKLLDFAACLSLSNLCFLNVWDEVQDYSFHYFAVTPPRGYLLLGAVLNVFFLATLLWALATLLRRVGNRFVIGTAKGIFLASLLLPLNFIRATVLHLSVSSLTRYTGRTGLAVAAVCTGSGALFLIAQRRAQFFDGALRAVRVALPLLPIVFLRAAWGVYLAEPPSVYEPKPVAAVLPQSADAPRVVWIVFDELDEYALFDGRPAELPLPEFDRFVQESLRARRAFPAQAETLFSLPALIDGERVADARPAGANELLLRLPGVPGMRRWSRQSNVFARAHAAGFNSSLVGWGFPYCRILDGLYSCSYASTPWPLVTDEHARRIGVVHTAIGQIQRQLRHTPFSGILHLDELPEVHDPKLLAVVNEEHIAAYKKIIHDSLAAAVDSRANLVFLHLPVPHPIGIYNRDTGAFDSTGARDYFDNVTLADHALGEIRRAMEAAGLWDRSAVLVTADHPLRVELWATEPGWSPMSARSTGNRSHPLVPFLWKAPGQTTAAAYDGAFNTVMTDRLMLAYLRGEAAGPLGVVRWLEANRNSVPVE